MLGKKSRPVIGILTEKLLSGNRSGLVDIAASPRSHLESKTQSPKGLKKSFDFGGVGLGIVAVLEKSGDGGRTEIPALFSRNLSRSNPIPVPRNKGNNLEELMVMESSEDYTIVTCHKGPNKSYTKVYCDVRRKGDDKSPFRIQKSNRTSVFYISPARFGDVAGAPATDFLSSCHLCQKKLQGEDIYMYRGEKAFCSTECRYRQIVMDERKEKCSSAVDLSTSPYTNCHMFDTGILAI